MRYSEVAANVQALVKDSPAQQEFVYKFLLAYGTPNASIARLRSGRMNLAKVNGTALFEEKPCRYAGRCNTFTAQKLSEAHMQALTEHVIQLLQQRENHTEKTMAQFYGPDEIPASLRAAHQQLDLAVDRIYRKAPFTSDEERLEHLFKRYEVMIAAEQKGKK